MASTTLPKPAKKVTAPPAFVATPKDSDVQGSFLSIKNIALTTVITLLIPFLYVIGRSYTEDYLSAYGMSSELFQRSTQDYLYYALYGIFQNVAAAFLSLNREWWQLLIVAIVLSVATFIYTFISKPNPLNIDKWLNEHTFFKKMVVSCLAGFLFVIVYYSALVAILFILLIPISIGQHAGKEVAKDEIRRDVQGCEPNKTKDASACINVFKGDKLIIVGRIIASSTEYVAIAKNGKATVLSNKDLVFVAK